MPLYRIRSFDEAPNVPRLGYGKIDLALVAERCVHRGYVGAVSTLHAADLCGCILVIRPDLDRLGRSDDDAKARISFR